MPRRQLRETDLRLTPAAFRRGVLRWYARHRRDLPWRRTENPWRILVSEFMLQQTQVQRVIPKYRAFVKHWPTPAALAAVPLSAVLAAWSGLGYNRRAKHLRAAAQQVVAQGGAMPRTVEGLQELAGVGPYTARAVASFAYNADVALWDTNVRRIALRAFYGGEFAPRDPGDAELQDLLEVALPHGRSRDWHNALMDFGSAVCVSRAPACAACPLRKACVAAPRFLAGDAVPRRLVRPQAKFEGSARQARGAVVRLLTRAGDAGLSVKAVSEKLDRPDTSAVLASLEKEGMVVIRRGRVSLP